MSSSRSKSTPAGPSRRGWPARLRSRFDGWSLRRRLLAAILALFALAFLTIGVVSTLTLRTVLIRQVDAQLSKTDQHAGGGGGAGPPNTGRFPPIAGAPGPNGPLIG